MYNMSCMLCGLCDHVIDVWMMFITWIVMNCVLVCLVSSIGENDEH